MKVIVVGVFLALGLVACSDSQQDRIDEINEENAQKATEYIKKPLEQAKDVRELTEKKYDTMEK